MAINKAQCPSCGLLMDVDSTKEAFVCISCGTPFVVANAINKYAQSAQGQQLEDGLKKANTLLNLKEWDKAKDVFVELAGIYPHDARTWLGIAKALSHDRSCHTVTHEVLDEIRSTIEKARILNLYIADNSWDVYFEHEQERLDRAENVREMTRRKLQSEYDQLVHRAKYELQQIVRVKRSKRKTCVGLGLGLFLGCAAAFGFALYVKLCNPLMLMPSVVLAMMIASGAIGAIGLILLLVGLCTKTKEAYMPTYDVERFKSAVTRIQESAVRAGVTIDMREPIRTYISPKKSM